MENETISSRDLEETRPDPILEVSEPVTPESGPSLHGSPGTSALTQMLRHSPEERNDDSQSDSASSHSASNYQLPKSTSNGTKPIPDENSPLLGKGSEELNHPDYLGGQPDIENQGVRYRPSWPKFRKVARRPLDKTVAFAKLASNPKRWDRQAIWEKGIKEPVGFLPPVVLGVLLNILDALSYGRF
jgi:SulP family sulfate permease